MTALLRGPEKLGRGSHACTVFSTDAEHRHALVEFARSGLDAGDRVLYFTERSEQAAVRLFTDAGLPVEEALASRHLGVRTMKESDLAQLTASPVRMLEVLQQSVDEALESGHDGARFTGDMWWVLASAAGIEEILAYETLLAQFLRERPAAALCQYDARRLAPHSLDAVIEAHDARLVPSLDGQLREVEVLPGGRHLALRGQFDLMNLTALTAAIDQVAMASGTRHVWAGDLEFIDVQSVRELLRLYTGPGSLVIHQPPRLLSKILSFCWPHAAEVRP